MTCGRAAATLSRPSRPFSASATLQPSRLRAVRMRARVSASSSMSSTSDPGCRNRSMTTLKRSHFTGLST